MGPRLNQQFDFSVYSVGWLCANAAEVNISRRFLDEEYAPPTPQPRDENGYIVGRMGNHYLVIAFPLAESSGLVSFAHTVAHLTRTFYNIRFGLMVGTGGGAPSAPHPTNPLNDIRLGDVVVSQPNQAHGKIYIILVISAFSHLFWSILFLTCPRWGVAIRQGPVEW
jgi:hypothetical protein